MGVPYDGHLITRPLRLEARANENTIRKVSTMAPYSGRTRVPRLAFAVPMDPEDDASGVIDPRGGCRMVGDRWSEAIEDRGMVVTIDLRNGALQVVLTIRIDSFTDRDWAAAEAMPTTIAVLPWVPILAFAIELDGTHACGFYPIGADPEEAAALRGRLDGDGWKTLVIVGVSRNRIRLLKRGVHLERLFEIFADTCTATPPAPLESDFAEALDILVDPPDVLFREAMAIYLGYPCE